MDFDAANPIDPLRRMIGVEHPLDAVSAALRGAVRQLEPAAVGALMVNCSDESEWECCEAFQRQFVEPLLPDLKHAVRSPFRTSNLGARYERGSIAVAEQHFALPAAADAFKVIVVKLNAHVAATDLAGGRAYGPLSRYDVPSSACGALHLVLAGHALPALDELRDTFSSDGVDRIRALRDPRVAATAHRYLAAAIVNARLQGGRAAEDIRMHQSRSTTVYLIVSCVTLNLPGPDNELVVGCEVVDERSNPPGHAYVGLGDRPERYRIKHVAGRLHVTEVPAGGGGAGTAKFHSVP